MIIKPREYQQEAIASIFDYFAKNKEGNPIVAMPCGTGKSVIIGGFLEQVFRRWPNQKIMVVTHVKELIKQNHAKLLNMWPTAPAGIHSAGLGKRDIYSNIIFCGIGSIVRKAESFGHIDLIIIDECDLVSPTQSTMYQRFIADIKKTNPRIRVIGLTATPWRSKEGHIAGEDSVFTDVCYDSTGIDKFNWFIDEGYLSPLIPRSTDMSYDVSSVGVVAGEYNQKQLQHCVDRYELTVAALKEALELGHDRKRWLVFCAGVEHSLHAAEILNDMGINARAIHSGNQDHKISPDQRDKILSDFDNGEITAVTNNSVLSVGYDNTKIDLIIHLKPMKSSRVWVQELGRGTRADYEPGYDLSTKQGRLDAINDGVKNNCLVLDFPDNTKNLGAINNPLIPAGRGKKKGGGIAPVKICPQCKIYVHASSRECFHCAYEFPENDFHINTTASTKELIVTSAPVIEEFKVDHMTFSKHTKKSNNVSSLMVTYYSNLRSFKEFVHLERENMKRSNQIWWSQRTNIPLPFTVDHALQLTHALKTPKAIQVWTNKQYPEILKIDFG